MSSIELRNVSLDYLIKTGSNSIKRSAVHLLNRCFRTSASNRTDIKNSSYRALNNINLQINKGERIGLLGRNGAGKSTLLRVLAKIYKPNLGEIEINGKVSNLFDVSSGMNTESTGYENILNLAIMRRISKKNALNMMEDIETFTELREFLNSPVKTYSTGMLLKLAFAVATSIPSDIILIDEIIGTGDMHFMDKATKRLESMIEQSHILVLASHSNDIIKRFCNKVIVLDRGQIQFFGDVDTGIDFYTKESEK
ncbi:ABC transporter ATP-binding protein [Legionella fallonii]|uniref:O-antigen export system ATP-binding protein RfbE n=1 Tax=Legionella fallonii LLAP-10 TaxID=1212491 RepID=A0A098G6U6_9GAMM|nr:ATP-binding cassette domain-containing protein [Legionella fallonii]CEG57215.1 O-antigen export system ATP-binding protein RfbE [Legionella fallonii LLAP-10]